MKYQFLGADGKPIELSPQEKFAASRLQRQYNEDIKPQLPGYELSNALGYEIDMTSLTQLIKSVSTQKLHEINFADYLPVVVGEGAWTSQLTKFRSFDVADDFETGIVNTGAGNAKLASVDTAIDAVNVPVISWAKEIGYSLMDLKFASTSGNWDLVQAKESARYRNWSTGVQKVAFWGSKTNANVKGLLTLSGVTSNITRITKKISAMTAAEFNAFVSNIMEDYRANNSRTAKPTHFIMPEDDYNGLISYPDATYPVKTKLELLTEAFRTVTQNQNFKILPCSYAMKSLNAGVNGLNKNRYVLLNYDKDSLRMDIPVNYTTTLQNTINGFTFHNAGYGQFSGAVAYRAPEVMYFDF